MHNNRNLKTDKTKSKFLSVSDITYNVFNNNCPTVGIRKKVRAPAGCVCIATAQIIAYPEYPKELICDSMNIDYSKLKSIYSFNDGVFDALL